MSKDNYPEIEIPDGCATFAPDPTNPDFRVPRISGIDHDRLSISEQIEQMDQRITLTMQGIDADLSNVYNVILTRILPQIKNYSLATENSRKTARYWKSFFEHAAQVKVPQNGEETFAESYYNNDKTETGDSYGDIDKSVSETFNQDSFLGQLAVEGASSTPLPKKKQTEFVNENSSTLPTSLESPFEKLRRQIRENDDDDLNFENTTNSTSILPSFSLPSASEVHDERTANYSNVADESIKNSTPTLEFNLKNQDNQPNGKENESFDNSKVEKTPKMVNKTSNITNNNPFGGPNWNGIADLRTTPLRTGNKVDKFNFSNQKYRQPQSFDIDSDDDDDDDLLPPGMSPPQTMNFTMPKSKLSRTPAKEAAANIVDDILKEAGQSNKKFGTLDKIDDEDEDEDTLMHQGSFMTRNYNKNSLNVDDTMSTSSSADDTAIQPIKLNDMINSIPQDSDSDNSIDQSSVNINNDASDTLFGPQSNFNKPQQQSKLQLHGDVTSTWFGTNIENASHDPQSPLG